ncbi:MAG: hypothetical protein AB7G93_07170 [Bdellovibrionales bacterium]
MSMKTWYLVPAIILVLMGSGPAPSAEPDARRCNIQFSEHKVPLGQGPDQVYTFVATVRVGYNTVRVFAGTGFELANPGAMGVIVSSQVTQQRERVQRDAEVEARLLAAEGKCVYTSSLK